MYEYREGTEGFEIIDENGSVVATAKVEADAREIVAALNLVGEAVRRFPGLGPPTLCLTYRCPRCGGEWEEEGPVACNSECERCAVKDITPAGIEEYEQDVNGGDLVDLFAEMLVVDAEGRFGGGIQLHRRKGPGKIWKINCSGRFATGALL
jgi:hypothetical protein